jgi:hypothetical protein
MSDTDAKQVADMVAEHEKEKAVLLDKIQALNAACTILCNEVSDKAKRITQLEQLLSGKPQELAA